MDTATVVPRPPEAIVVGAFASTATLIVNAEVTTTAVVALAVFEFESVAVNAKLPEPGELPDARSKVTVPEAFRTPLEPWCSEIAESGATAVGAATVTE